MGPQSNRIEGPRDTQEQSAAFRFRRRRRRWRWRRAHVRRQDHRAVRAGLRRRWRRRRRRGRWRRWRRRRRGRAEAEDQARQQAVRLYVAVHVNATELWAAFVFLEVILELGLEVAVLQAQLDSVADLVANTGDQLPGKGIVLEVVAAIVFKIRFELGPGPADAAAQIGVPAVAEARVDR